MAAIVTANIKWTLSRRKREADVRKILRQRPDIIGFQEVSGANLRQVKAILERRGYGFVIANGNPVAYKKSKYRRKDVIRTELSKRTHVGPRGAGPDTLKRKEAVTIVLRNKKTGKIETFTNAHLAPSIYIPIRGRLHRQQVRRLAALQDRLERRYGNAWHYMVGDFNTSKRAKLAALGDSGYKLHRAPRKTHRAGYIDWIISNRPIGEQAVMDINSDHHFRIAAMGRDADLPKAAPAAGGGNGGGDTGPTAPQPAVPGRGPGEGNRVPLSAYDLLADLLESWGIPVGRDVRRIIERAAQEGITPDQINLIIPEIQETRSWKDRFPGWHARVNNGYSQLTVGEYLQLEDAYHRIMDEAGLPPGFYDDPSDFGNWIANNVSPDEIQERVSIAMDTVRQVDPTARDLLGKFYGVTSGDLAAYFLDQKRALPQLERQFQAVNVAAWASRHGLKIRNARHYEDLIDKGLTPEQAAQGYGTVAAFNDAFGRIANVYGETFTQEDAERDVFFNDSEKRRKLMSREAAAFSGSSRGMTGSAQRATDY